MKSNKGFTLIELLAVIVILAIIALIATPTILGVIETAREGSAKSSALGYIDAVEKQLAIDMLDNGALAGATGTKSVDSLTSVKVKGAKPASGHVVIDGTTGEITTACLNITINNKTYPISYENGTARKADSECQNS